MDELELVRSWDESAPPAPAVIEGSRKALEERLSEPAGRRPALAQALRQRVEDGLGKVALLGAIATAAIMAQPHTPLGLPGHRALGWLSLLLIMRLVGGTGWASGVGIASALGTMLIGRSPNGNFWGVLQYVVAGIGIDAFLWMRPRIARNPLMLAGVGGALLVLVGWITPVSNSFVGGVPLNGIWVSLSGLGLAGWERLVGYDLLFGVSSGLIAYCVGWVLSQSWQDLSRRLGMARS